jgi:hypothetical protein
VRRSDVELEAGGQGPPRADRAAATDDDHDHAASPAHHGTTYHGAARNRAACDSAARNGAADDITSRDGSPYDVPRLHAPSSSASPAATAAHGVAPTAAASSPAYEWRQ